MKLHTFKIGGVHPEEHKITADVATVQEIGRAHV